jgi:cAMP phosphodiesterase
VFGVRVWPRCTDAETYFMEMLLLEPQVLLLQP